MKVYIRHADDDKARYLTEVSDFNDAPKVVAFVKEQSVQAGGVEYGKNDTWSTQVVVDDEDAYLEIVFG